MKIRLVQFQPQKDKTENIATSLFLARRQGIESIDLLLFPELFSTGYQLENIATLAEDEKGETLSQFQQLALETKTTIFMGSIAYRTPEKKLQNTAFVISPQGNILGHYSKIHLFSLMEEEKYFTSGQNTFLFEVGNISCGAMICYDLRFPEIARKLVIQGAQVLFVPMEWPAPRTEIFRTLLKARAIENQCFVVGNNICGLGLQPHVRFEGKSMVVNPFGETVAELGEQADILDVELDLALVQKCRKQIPCFQDRRPELY